jgi:hypothetical protein
VVDQPGQIAGAAPRAGPQGLLQGVQD